MCGLHVGWGILRKLQESTHLKVARVEKLDLDLQEKDLVIKMPMTVVRD